MRRHGNRAQIGEQPELLANLQEADFWSCLRVRIVPLRTTDGTEQHRLRSPASCQSLLRQRVAELVDRTAADRAGRELKRMPEFPGDCDEDTLTLSDHFRTNPVTGEQHDLSLHCESPFQKEDDIPRDRTVRESPNTEQVAGDCQCRPGADRHHFQIGSCTRVGCQGRLSVWGHAGMVSPRTRIRRSE